MKFLHDDQRVAGMTVSRGIAGFGADGKLHTASLVDLSLDLPLIVEFYDQPERVEEVIADLMKHVRLSHVITWPATVHSSDM
jgi:PII-like signaling protein